MAWLLAVAGGLLIGLDAWKVQSSAEWISRFVEGAATIRWLSALGAMLAGVSLASMLVTKVCRKVDECLDADAQDLRGLSSASQAAHALSGMLVGMCEKVLVPVSLLVGQPGAIAVWVAMKVAVQWKRWTGESSGTQNDSLENDFRSRRRFDAFIVGTFTSLASGVLVYLWVQSYVTYAPNPVAP